MWIMTTDSFLSIVKTDTTPDEFLLVRGRVRGDIETIFPGVKVTRTPKSDYLFRALVPTHIVMKAIAKEIKHIDYGNFKNAVIDDERHNAYLSCWIAMNDLQKKKSTRKKKTAEPTLSIDGFLFSNYIKR